MKEKITNQLEDDFKKKLIPMQMIALLPPTVAKYFFLTWVLSKNKECNFYNSTTPKLYHMSQDDCDIALQTLIDNGFVKVTSSGDWYKCIINYDKFEEFDYRFMELFNKDDIKLSTEVTFKNNKVEDIINQLSHSEKEEIVKRLGNELAYSTDKEEKREVMDEMTRECFLLSKKNTNLPF